MDISNKTLAIFLLAAMVVSLGGTIISISQISDLSQTGLATSDTGDVQLNVQGSVSITTEDSNLIDFGDCTPFSGDNATINSENTKNTSTVCSSNSLPQNISVRNDGNVAANVTLYPNETGAADGGTFLDSSSSDSQIRYKTNDDGLAGNTGGCSGNLQTSYTNLTATGSGNAVLACDNLDTGDTQNSFVTNVEIVVPFDAPTGSDSVQLTFSAEQA